MSKFPFLIIIFTRHGFSKSLQNIKICDNEIDQQYTNNIFFEAVAGKWRLWPPEYTPGNHGQLSPVTAGMLQTMPAA
ncbi:hypothetical protein MKQ68_12410 [Chitinophaga horti]|uniref:Uncharacterized protein n=1 Tax=Chitinophaga horti TaxID=2920382 RepID=A0ABY6J891_9BACT|nr:hypothetical protein [Chitinophaga horti]UYQ95903.1 hypothetical protein MKQ68_12410 [Chitinophaga horti]